MTCPNQTEQFNSSLPNLPKGTGLNISQASELLGISPSSLRRFEKEGRITSNRQSNGYRVFYEADILKLKSELTSVKEPKIVVTHTCKKAPKGIVIKMVLPSKEQVTERLLGVKNLLPNLRNTKVSLAIATILVFFIAYQVLDITGGNLFKGRNDSKMHTDYYGKNGKVGNLLGMVTDIQKTVLGTRDRVTNFVYNINVPTNISSNLKVSGTTTTQSLDFQGTGLMSNLKGIDTVTKATLENSLGVTGTDITGTNLKTLKLANSITYTGDWDFDGTWSIKGTEVAATAEEINDLAAVSADVVEVADLATYVTELTTIANTYYTEITNLVGGDVNAKGIPFGDGTKYVQDLANLYYDSTNHRMGLGTSTPTDTLTVNGTASFNGNVTANYEGIFGFFYRSGTIISPTSPITELNMTSGQILDLDGDVEIADTNITLNGTSTTFTQANGDIILTPGTNDSVEVTLPGNGKFIVDTNVLSVNSATDRVGVGTLNPSHKLDVMGNIGVTDQLMFGNTTFSIDGDTSYGIRASTGVMQYKNTTGNWTAIGSGGAGTPGDPATSIQFNQAGGFGGDNEFLYNNSSNVMMIPNIWAFNSAGLKIADDGGNLGVYVADGGYVGIGMSSPARQLSVNGAIRLETLGIAPTLPTAGDIYSDGTNLYYYNGSTWDDLTSGGATASGIAGSIQFSNGTNLASDVTKLFWDDAQKRLGIGTSAPAYELDVNGDARATNIRATTEIYKGSTGLGSTAAASGASVIGYDASGRVYSLAGNVQDAIEQLDAAISGVSNGSVTSTGSANYLPKLNTQTALVNSILYESSGKIGIGLTNPGYTLDVNGQINATNLNIGGTQITATALELNTLDGITSNVTELNYLDGLTVSNGGIIFGNGTFATQDLTDLFWNASTNRLGIGTSDPQYNVDVTGSVRATTDLFVGSIGLGSTATAGTSGATLIGIVDDTMTYITGNTNVQSAIKQLDTAIGSVSGGSLSGTGPSNYLTKYTGTSTIGASILYETAGKIGIGLTNPSKELEVAGDIGATNIYATTDMYIGSIGLGATAGATTSGAYKIGAFDEFDNSTGTNVQAVLNDLDAAISTVSSTALTGTGPASYITMYTGTGSTLGSSVLYQTSGKIGLGMTNPSKALEVSGDVAATNLYATTDVFIGSIGLGATASATTSGAYKIGVFGEFSNSSSTNVQAVLNDLDAAIATVSGGSLSGTGPTNYVTKYTGSATLGASLIYDNGTNVGIGTTAPLYKLHVSGDALISTRLGIGSTNALYDLNVGNTAAFNNIFASGNVGIGTTNPLYKLDVTGDIRTSTDLYIGSIGLGATASATTSGAYKIGAFDEFSYSSSTNVQGVLKDLDTAIGSVGSGSLSGTGPANYLTKYTGAGSTLGSSVLYETSGKIGLGMTNPSKAFEVSGDISATNIYAVTEFYLGATGLGSTAGASALGANSAGLTYSSSSTIQGILADLDSSIGSLTSGSLSGTGPSNYITKYVSAGVLGSSIIYETSSKLGIGLTNPTYTVDISGTLGVTSDIYINNVGLGATAGTTTSGAYKIGVFDEFGNSANTNVQAVLNDLDEAISTVSSGSLSGTSPANYLPKYTGASTLGSSILYETGGKIGVSTTNPGYTFDVNGNFNTTGFYLGGTAVTATAAELNFLDGTTVANGGVMFANGTYMTQDLPNFFWDDSTNRLGIGTSAPLYTAHINGDALISTRLGIGSTNALYDLNVGNTSMFANIFATGQFAIGTTAPTAGTLIDVVGGNIQTNKQFVSTLATGTSPFSVSSTTVNTNLNADLLDGQHGSYYLATSGVSGPTNYIAKFTGANSVGASTMYDDGTNVGVGTTAPLYKLHVSGDALISTRLGIGSTNALYDLNVGNTAAFNNIFASGNVGIGTTAPGAKLVITGGATRTGDTNDGLQLYYGTGYGEIKGIDINAGGYNDIRFTTSATPGMVLTTGGNVGIGTTNPLYKLHVSGDALISTRLGIGSTNALYNLNVGGTSMFADIYGTGRLALGTTAPTAGTLIDVVGGNIQTNLQFVSTLATGTSPFSVSSTTVNTNLNADLLDGQHGSYYLSTTNVSGPTNYVARFTGANTIGSGSMYDDGTKVGIGTTAPLYTLQVTGDALISTRLGIGSTNALYDLNVGNTAAFNNIHATGVMGIGTTAAGAKLEVENNGDIIALLVDQNDNDKIALQIDNAGTGNTIQLNTGDFIVDYLGNITSTGTTGITLHASADVTIGSVGIRDTGTGNTTSGASLIGVNQTSFTQLTGANVQLALESVDSQLSSLQNGVITQVGSITSGIAFSSVATADDQWLGFGSGASDGRILFNDNTVDELFFLNTKVGIGSTALTGAFDVKNSITATTGNAYGSYFAQTLTEAASLDVLNAMYISPTFAGAFGDSYQYGLTVAAGDVRIGLGASNPTNKLFVQGNVGIESGSYLNFGYTEGTTGYGLRDSGGSLQFKNATGAWTNLAGDYWQVDSGGTTLSPLDLTKHVGIGTSATTYNLEVVGDALISTRLGIGSTNALYNLNVGGTSMLADLFASGKLGIGTTAITAGTLIDIVGGNIQTNKQFVSTLATGTSPFSVTSTTVNTNLNADLLDGQHGSYYLSTTNVSGPTNYVARFTGANTIGSGSMYDDGTKVGIGTTAPLYTLQVAGDALISTRLGIGSTNALYNLNVGGTSMFADIFSNGRLALGTTAPTAFFDLNAATASTASMRVRTGTTPTSPNTGDIYSDGTDLFFYNGAGWDDLTQTPAIGNVGEYTKGYKQGFSVGYVDTNTLAVGPGTMEINGQLYNISATINKDTSSPAVSTWYYVYAKAPASGADITATDIVLSATAPTRTESKRGYYENSLGLWRAVGAIYSDTSANIQKFYNEGKDVYFDDIAILIIITSPSNSWNDVTMHTPLWGPNPLVKTQFQLVRVNADSNAYIRTNGSTSVNGDWVGSVNTTNSADVIYKDVVTDSTGKIEAMWDASTTNQIRIFFRGYVLPEWIRDTGGMGLGGDLWTQAGSELYYNGNVGIGNTNPAYLLDVSGIANMTTLSIGGTSVTSTATELNYLDGTTVTNGGVMFANGTNMIQDVPNLFWNDSTNRLGIGTSAPLYTAHINGDALISTRLGIGSTNALYNLNVGGTSMVTDLFSTGSFGIGTTAISEKLTLNGALALAYSSEPTAVSNYFKVWGEVGGTQKLLLHMDGIQGSTSFTDSSLVGNIATSYQGLAISTAQAKFGQSGYFDGGANNTGTGDVLLIADSANWDFGTGNFTIDFWVYPTDFSTYRGYLGASGLADLAWILYSFNDGVVRLTQDAAVSNIATSGNQTLTLNQWNHVALVRKGTGAQDMNIYINGVAGNAPTSGNVNVNALNNLVIGRTYSNSDTWYFKGYMDEVQITKGQALWTNNFDVPTTAYSTQAGAKLYTKSGDGTIASLNAWLKNDDNSYYTQGRIGIGVTPTTASFAVGSGSQIFQVSSTGAISSVTGITSTGDISNTKQFISTLANGSAPFILSSSSMSTNLNADLLDGQHGAYYLAAAGVSGPTNYIAKFTGSNAVGASILYDNGTNVGIGTTAPLYNLQVAGDALISTRLGIGSTNALYNLNVGGTSMLADLFASGKLGIGTTAITAGTLIDVMGGNIQTNKQFVSTLATGTSPFSVSSTTVNTNLNADLLDGQHGSYYLSTTNVSGPTNYVAKFTGANTIGASTIYDNGTSVGIGTTAIAGTFTVSGNIGETSPGSSWLTTMALMNTNTAVGAFNRLAFMTNADSYAAISSQNLGSVTGNITFETRNAGGNLTTKMLLDPIGNLGIGVTSPLYKLQVAGDALISTRLGIGSTNALYNLNVGGTSMFADMFASGKVGIGTTAPAATLHVYVANTTPIQEWDTGGDGGQHLTLKYEGDQNAFIFETTAGRNVAFDMANNFGIGTTAPTAKLDVNSVLTGSTGTEIGTNISVNYAGTSGTEGFKGLNMLLTGDATVGTGDKYGIYVNTADSYFDGSLLYLAYNNNRVFEVSDTQAIFDVPVNVASSGDLGVANNLNFTNITASYITSDAPLYIQAGNAGEAESLFLSSAGTGDVYVDDTLRVTGDIYLNTGNKMYFDNDGGNDTYLSHSIADGRLSLWVDGYETARFMGVSSTSSVSMQLKGTLQQSQNFDIAEMYPTMDETIAAGMIVSVEKQEDIATYTLVKAKGENDSNALGIISTDPGIVMGAGSFRSEFCETVKANGADAIIAKELAAFGDVKESTETTKLAEEKVATIKDKIQTCTALKEVPVTLSGRVPVRVAPDSAEIKLGDALTISTTYTGYAKKSTVAGQVIVAKALQAWNKDSKENTIMVATGLVWNSAQAANVSADGLLDTLTTTYNEIKKFTDSLGFNFDAANNVLNINADLSVLGDTTLGNLTVTKDLNVGLFKVDSLENSIEIVGRACGDNKVICEDQTLHIQKNLAGNIDMFNGKVIFLPNGDVRMAGNLTVKSITADEYNVAGASKTIGTAVMKAGTKEVVVTSDMIKSDSKIFVTPTGNTKGNALYIKNKVEGESFTVAIDSTIGNDVEFDWFIVNIK